MKKLKYLIGISLLALASGSCADQLAPEEKPGEGTPISIECVMRGYTKAGDTSFEEGDQIGLYIYTPDIYLDNGQFTYRNGEFAPETPYLWYDGISESELIAYYPYRSQAVGKDRTIQFCVNADQRTHRNYTASDLMVARKTACPTSDAVVLPFEHVLSKVMVTVDNKLGEDIAEVMFTGVKGAFKYSIDNNQIEFNGKAGIVKAARSDTDKSQWAMVLPPQEVSPDLVVITAGQKEYRYHLDKIFKLESGKCHSAAITINVESVSTEISPEIKDWLPGNDLNFGQDYTEDEWVPLGTGTLIDDAVGPFLNLPVSVLEVAVQRHRNQEGLYRVADPYKKAPFYDQYASDIPGELIFEITDTTNNRIRLHDSKLGLKAENGEFMLCQSPDGYGFFDRQDQNFIFMQNSLRVKVGQSEGFPANRNGFFMLVLPGGNLPVMDQFHINGMTVFTGENGTDQIRADVFVHMNYCKDIFYKFYDSDVDINQEYQKYLKGELQMTPLSQPKAGMENTIVYTPGKSGRYTILLTGKDAAGTDFGKTASCTYVKEGEAIPEPVVDLTVKQNPNYPEGELLLGVKVQDQFLSYQVRYAPVNEPGKVQAPMLYFAPIDSFHSEEGAVVSITNLKPSTDYRITVSVTALDEKVYSYETHCTTAPESSYTLLGKGRFIDNSQFIGWYDARGEAVMNYESPVEIYQDNSNPDKFRMMAPYKNYWANADSAFIRNQLPYHNGHESAYVDFYRYIGPDGRVHVAFSEIDTGASHPQFPGTSLYYGALGEMKYGSRHYCYLNSIELEDGLFGLNPISTFIRNTSQYYGLMDFGNSIRIQLPRSGSNTDPVKPGQGVAFNYFEVPQTLKAKQEYKYILHTGETYTSHQKVRNYSACYDTRRHNPMWVAFPHHAIWKQGGFGRPAQDPWRPDPQMTESEQSIIYANDWSDWPWSANGGRPVDNKQFWTLEGASFYFTKGHLMRSAERGTRDKNTLFKMNEQTFYPTNISPERYPTVKRASDNKSVTHWALIEGIMPDEWCCSDTLYVVAGCYYGDDSIKVIDASNNGNRSPETKDCVVPTARWKVFLRTKSGVTGKPVSQCRADELMAIAFWFPQCLESSNIVAELPPLAEYTLSVNALEAKIGGEFNFFPQVPAEVCETFNPSDWPKLNDIYNVRLDAHYSGPYIY